MQPLCATRAVKPRMTRRGKVGAFGRMLLKNLKKAPAGSSIGDVIAETILSIPPERLRKALDKCSALEHNMLFRAVPSRLVKALLDSLPASVLAPTTPPAAPPTPAGVAPASILQTTYQNVPYPPGQSDPNNWAQNITNGQTIGLNGVPEWVSVYDPDFEKEGSLNNPMVGLTGWTVLPDFSRADVWFVHPFGFDYEYYIVPDQQYENLLAPSNAVTGGDDDYSRANAAAQNLGFTAAGKPDERGIPGAKGVLGVETDKGLVLAPPTIPRAIGEGTRIATFGRWIVDCGHNDFHSEIHPPLLIAAANPAPAPAGSLGASEMTSVQITSRPYLVSQRFDGGDNFVGHLLNEVTKVETTILGIPLSGRVEAHPTIFTTPYDGRPVIKLLVQPPPRKGIVIRPQQLMVSFHFTHRAGVAARVFGAGNGTVGIIIVLGDLNPAPLPPRHDFTVEWDRLGDFQWLIAALEIADSLTVVDWASALILAQGILTDIYDAPSASSPLDNQNVAAPVAIEQLQAWAGFSEDDSQPFPIYGWLNVWWQEQQQVLV